MRNYFSILLFTILFFSCNSTTEPELSIKNELNVKVYNTDTWDAQTNTMDFAVGAVVHLVSDATTITSTTDINGIASFSNVVAKNYTLLASKENLSNLINTEAVNNKLIGNLILGVYASQAEIDMSPYYANAKVGGVKLLDVNGDGLINTDDKVYGSFYKFEYKYRDVNEDGIIDVFDLINGNLVKIDNISQVNMYIGK